MANDKIDQILEARKKPAAESTDGERFFSIPAVGDKQEDFLEFRFRTGIYTCFPYSGLTWFNYDPDGIIDIEFSGYKAQIKGRGLLPLFHGIKAKQVAWIKEADTEMQDNEKNEHFVEEIDITSPGDFTESTETN